MPPDEASEPGEEAVSASKRGGEGVRASQAGGSTDESGTEDAGLAVRSNWWWSHAAIVGWTLLFYAFVVLNAVVLDLGPGETFIVVQAWLFVYVTFGIGAFFGFFYDTKAIRDAGKAWSPWWWLYLLASFVFTPSVTSVVYLAQRLRHVGIRARGRQFGPL